MGLFDAMGLFAWNKQPDRDDDQAEDPGDYLVDPPGLWAADGGPHPDDEADRTVTLVGWAGPDFDDNLRAGLGRPLAWDRADDEEG